MQSIIDFVVAHSAVILVVVYEVWSLIPESVVKSSSILTWIGAVLSKFKPGA